MGGEDDGFGARGADFVDCGAYGRVGKTGVEGTLASGILAQTAERWIVSLRMNDGGLWVDVLLGREDIAVEDFFDILGLQ